VVREVDADGHAEERVDLAHPVGVAPGEVVVHRDDVHALARQRVEVRGQRGDERLAFARSHLRDLAVVQDHAADELHVEMTHAQRALRGLAHHGERFGQQGFEASAVGEALAEFGGLGAQLLVREPRNPGLERVDLLYDPRVLLQQPLVAAAEDLPRNAGEENEELAQTFHGIGGAGSYSAPGKSGDFITPGPDAPARSAYLARASVGT
jgi:hypothetical protein